MTVQVRIVSSDEASTFELRDNPNGLFVESVQPPEENMRESIVVADDVDGDYSTSESYEPGVLTVFCRVQGTSWPQTTLRWQAARTAYRAERNFYVETVIDGVTTRYRTRRPNVTGGELTGEAVANCMQTYVLRFPVQPHPSITID